MEKVLEQEVIVKNTAGLHARPAAMIAAVATKAEAEIFFEYEGEEIDCRSVLSMLMMAAGQGSKLTLRVSGENAEKYFEEIILLFENKFNEG